MDFTEICLYTEPYTTMIIIESLLYKRWFLLLLLFFLIYKFIEN